MADPHEARIQHILHELEGTGTRRVRVGGFDIDGVLRGKYITYDKLVSALHDGLGFCDVIFGWDSADELYDNTTLTGWHTGYPDLVATVDTTSLRRVPWEDDLPFFLLDFALPDGRPFPASPRQVLRRVATRAAEMGFTPWFAAEYEFFLFQETSASIRDKGFRNLVPLSPGMFGYSALRASTFSHHLRRVVNGLDGFGIEVEGIHTETGPGVYEGAINKAEVLPAADHAALFKTAVKEIMAREGILASFMAKVSKKLPGCSGHVHQSLWKDGRPAFSSPEEPTRMSSTFKHYVAGVCRYLPELMALYCPTVNSYKRTVPGYWAPVSATWGFDNRTTALRVIQSASGKATRLENRLVGADMNPYLAFAASLASGLHGIRHELELGPPVSGNAYAGEVDATLRLPRSLEEATERLASSEMAREWLGPELVDHYVATRRWETRQYGAAVTDWELERYLEII
jgi:glutamine synthetase